MINNDSLPPLEASSFSPHLFKPSYDAFSFNLIPSTLKAAFGMQGKPLPDSCWDRGVYERVIFILLDGFGWNSFLRYQDQFPFLKRVVKEGIVSKISSQFPSTTTAHITTLCTDSCVGAHGLYEWFMYEPDVNEIVMPIIYQFSRDQKGRPLDEVLSPSQFFPQSTLFHDLKKQGIVSRIYLNSLIVDSNYSEAMYAGGERVSCRDEKAMMAALKNHLQNPGFFLLYYGGFDSLTHRHGLASEEAEKSLVSLFTLLENTVMTSPEMQLSSTALMLSADHGMTSIHPTTTYYLNEEIPELISFLQKDARGHVLAPSGSSRDFFLHVKKGCIKKVIRMLQDKLQKRAIVLPVQELIVQGFFGEVPLSGKFLERLGDVVILPLGSHSIWWKEKEQFEQKFYAMHGGLTCQELEIPFIFYRKKG
ncbi:alkaline phosphatase family protein [Rhabdochlamydiaceae symbiont of Dictyostelium giganteum]|uniref:alkaline phosphatase family protein n=1 Tax=Rhabdochlamydiaceae symbiont of Dictyostelium giganteum TaxID=3342349 RepID=UPI00384E96A8